MKTPRILFPLTMILLMSVLPTLCPARERPVSVNFWPLFHYTSDPVEGVSEIEGLGPLFYWKKDSTQKEVGVRPLFYWTGDEDKPLWRLEFLYPFGKYQIKEHDRKGYFFPLSDYREETFDGRRKWSFQFFPFFIGETEEGRGYYGLFPLYGVLLNRYGKEDIRFFLWPLYSESTSEGTRTRNVIWPFFAFIDGEKEEGYRFWPFYGRREEFGVSRSEFLLWPIFVRKTKGLDTDDPMDEKMVFPFYVHRASKHFESRTYLWPFFSHAEERTTGFEQWDLPWPFFRTFKGEDLHGMRIFILYGYKVREGESKRVFVVYPLYQFEEDRMKDVEERTYRILFSRIRIGEDDQGVERGRSLRIWPLFDYEKQETGYETFSFLYLLPFKEEGLERNLFPFFRIFRWEKSPQGAISTNLFWGFFQRMKREEFDYWEIAHLVGFRRGQGWKSVSLLKGLFLYRKEGEDSDLRIFYLPFRFRWSGTHASKLPLAQSARVGTTVEPTLEIEGAAGGF